MPSSKKISKMILTIIEDEKQETIIDLGSGFGTLAIFLARNLPHKKVIGYELSLFPYFFSLLLKKVLKLENLEFYKKDFLKEDLKDSLLVCFLFPKGMEKLEDKLFDETINTTIVSSTFSFRNIKEREVFKVDDLYKTPIFYYRT